MIQLTQTQLWLFEVASEHGCTQEQYTSLIYAIMAPGNLQAFYYLNKELQETFSTVKKICEISGTDYIKFQKDTINPAVKAAGVLTGIQQIVEKKPLLSHLFCSEASDPEDAMEGILESHPLYSILAHQAEAGALKENYRHLKAQALLAIHILRTYSTKSLNKYLAAYRGVRYLSKSRHRAQLELVPANAMSPANFLNAIAVGDTDSRLSDSKNLIEKSLDGFREKSTLPRKPLPPITKSPDPLDDSPPEEEWTGSEIISDITLNDQEAKNFTAFGGTPSEFPLPSDSIPVVATAERVYTRSTLRELAFSAKQASNKIAIRNQFSQFAWQELNQADIATLLQFFTRNIPCPDLSSESERQVRILLGIMFWASCSIERALTLHFSTEQYPQIDAPECLYWDHGGAPYIRLFSPGPELSAESKGRQYKQAYAVTDTVKIPLCNLAMKALEQDLPLPTENIRIEERQLFPTAQEKMNAIQLNLKRTLKHLNREYGTRLTAGNISNHFLHHLSRWPGVDLPSAVLFFGQNQEPATTRIHYTLASLPQLEKCFISLSSQQLAEVGFDIKFPKPGGINRQEAAVGTPWCPTPQAVRDLVWDIQQTVENSRSDCDDLDSLANFHNHYTLYTALFLSFTTGFRAIRAPSIKVEEIHHGTGFLIVSDKDDDFHYSTRKVWLPEICLKQIGLYRQHLMTIWDSFGTTSEPFFKLFQKHFGPGLPLEFFYIDYDLLESETFRPSLTKKRLQSLFHYELPPNANRHYLKHQLLKSGCSQEIIETFLGHWGLGQEPWNSLSNLSPLTFKSHIKHHLEPILKRDGWKPVHGYGL